MVIVLPVSVKFTYTSIFKSKEAPNAENNIFHDNLIQIPAFLVWFSKAQAGHFCWKIDRVVLNFCRLPTSGALKKSNKPSCVVVHSLGWRNNCAVDNSDWASEQPWSNKLHYWTPVDRICRPICWANYFLFSWNIQWSLMRAAWRRGSIRASHPATLGSNLGRDTDKNNFLSVLVSKLRKRLESC